MLTIENCITMKNTLLLFLLSLATFTLAGNSRPKVVVKDKIKVEAKPFPLSDLRLLEGSLFKHAMDKDAQWLLDLEPDRLLYRFHLNAGLQPKGEIYGGWETLGVSGHTLGHYLSACSMMYAVSDDVRFKERVDYIVRELAVCQHARKTGYVGGIPNEDKIWSEVSAGDIRTEGFDLNGGWVPWYTLHKLWAGLIDAYRYTDNEQARTVVTKLSDWAVNSFGHLSEEQFQKMLRSEFGGMNEALAEMYAITGNKSYLRLARQFYHQAILDPLSEKRDELAGKHSNTQVPKIIGEARLYELTGDEKDHTITTFYWERMVNHHTYVNGGNSNYEHLGPPDCLNDRLSAFTSETCNTYNMLKLTRHLFSWDARAAYMDYYERALYNHILASQNPDNGMVCYCVPLESGAEKGFSTRYGDFWCCVGSGLENHVKYAESVFFESTGDKGLFVNLFIPTILNWKEREMEVKMETQFPTETKVRISFKGKQQTFPLHMRYPAWAVNGLKITLNGEEKTIQGTPGSYFTLKEKWGDNTTLTIDIPMSLHTVSMPDNPKRMGIFYGPILLAAPLGREEVKVYNIPRFISADGVIIDAIRPVAGKALAFTASTTSDSFLPLVPFYAVHDQKYAVYFDVFSAEEWALKEMEYRKMVEEQRALEARTTDLFRIGEMQPERDHGLESENSNFGYANGYAFRDAFNGWFSFNVEVDSKQKMQMICSYWGADKDKRNFDILIDGVLFKTVNLDGTHGNKVFEEVYEIPLSFTQGRKSITIRFQSHTDSYAGGLFGFRMAKTVLQ